MKSWPELIRWTFLVIFCLVAGGYAGMRVWRWASVARDAPVVGLSLDTAWHARAGITTSSYQLALTRAGAQILEVRPENGRPERILDQIDALLLAGGGDIDPALFGGEPSEAQLVDRDRDDFELALIRGALHRDMPVLGICRGIQILNVFQGGSVRNLRSDAELAATHGIDLDSMDAHSVEIAAGSKLGQLLGAGPRRVNSFHGQAVGEVGEGLRVAAQASDGVVEAIELPDRPFIIGMQWHPEAPPQQMAVFEAFLEAAKAYRQRRGR
ncbi:MAG TPA: gamma-glutamyl-gamma-aminobutyrate hydrolase family protein [Thermoguttaceae bacterium]|nr:gamma-glutamyl-gamma-aminobutyrate hydrolase family protein [Thermoguttaceae bacterium]